MKEARHEKMVRAALEIYAPPSGGGAGPGALQETVQLQFNPAALTLVKEVAWVRNNARLASTTSVPEFTGSQPRILTADVVLNKQDDQEQSVDKRVSQLLQCCVPSEGSLQANQPSPPWVRFRWGGFESVSYYAFVSKVTASYTRFSTQGDPLRAVCALTLEEIGMTVKGQNPTSGSPSSRHSYTFVQGDSLPSIAAQHSGRPADWRAIAEMNGIDDPSKVRPGRELLLPGAGADTGL
ncbi:LysM peptidoglycan-binding domain-containing protein [Streptomyces sp. NPDC058579]|uniref:CIS tube protein n=1 Tax=Streptomyces sp. NPDC058579 TaxID=3346548 RepID=UPI0036632FB4